MQPPAGFKAEIVQMILDGRAMEAVDRLSGFYRTSTPRIRVGVVRGRCQGVYGLYDPSHAIIFISRSDFLTDPRTVLHEFYHHLRFKDGRHRGTEKYADQFASDYIQSYLKSK